MSRTLKDRPYSVLARDPSAARYSTHNHIAYKREQVGEEVITRDGYDKNGRLIHDIPYWTRPLYKYWREDVECTLDLPETEQKQCHWWLEYHPNGRSEKDFKRLTNQATRGKIRQQLHTALIAELDWDEIDIYSDSKYDWYGWWD